MQCKDICMYIVIFFCINCVKEIIKGNILSSLGEADDSMQGVAQNYTKLKVS